MNKSEREYISSDKIIQVLEQRISILNALLLEKRKALKNVPSGSLRIAKSNGVVQYYRRMNPKDTTGSYIHAKDKVLVKRLAQKEYDKKVSLAVQAEIALLNHTLKTYNKMNDRKLLAEKVFEKFRPLWQVLIHPVRIPDSLYVQEWQSVTYTGKDFSEDMAEYLTARGERVRSKSEIIIADTLFRLKIPYHYEYPVDIRTTNGEKLTFYPDFTCLNLRTRQEFYWEHFGMMDNSEYSERAVQKLRLYEQNGIVPGKNLIITMETSTIPINTKQIELLAKSYLFNT
ncbi:MAG: hypothetical protein J5527_07240 [Treponema sp.]|nr:hypothetical protein [Treponema sp.]